MGRIIRHVILGFALLLAVSIAFTPSAQAAKEVKIGFSMALTGPLGPAGKAALLAMQIWRDDVNAKGGLLGRKVKLVYYDDQTKPANVPGIYAKLLDVDKVDFIVSGYGTNLIVPALPIAMERGMVFMGLFGLDANAKFKYNNYFQIMPAGPDPIVDWSRGFFELAAKQKPRPKTIALLSADAEFARNAVAGARRNAKKFGFKIVYDKRYPFPGTTDFTPILRAVKAANPDLFYVGSYPGGSVGIVKAAHEIKLEPKLFGGGMVGLQYTAIQMNLGKLLNGITDYWFWAPEKTLKFPGIEAFLAKYQKEAPKQKARPAGLLPAAVRLCLRAVARKCDRGHQELRSGEGRRLHPQQYPFHRGRRREVRQERRMGDFPDVPGAAPEHREQQDERVQQSRKDGGGVSRGVQVRKLHLPIRERQVTNRT